MLPFKELLSGSNIEGSLYKESDLAELLKVANSQDLWDYNLPAQTPLDSCLETYFNQLKLAKESGAQWPFIIRQKQDQKIVGSSRFYDISLPDKRCAIGFTWYHPSVWGSKVNPETKCLLLQHLFEDLTFNRVEFHVDARNDRSRAAMKKLGALQEGIMRKHKIVQGDFIRDTVLFSVISDDWPTIKEGLLNRIA